MTNYIVTPWHNPNQLDKFLAAWNISTIPDYLILQQDKTSKGCALTKNEGIANAMSKGAEIICILDDDCYPSDEAPTLRDLLDKHIKALEPQQVARFQVVTSPPSRGTPYFNKTMLMPVAASMGFWLNVGDYDAPAQLIHGATHPMEFHREPVFGNYFALSGMNIAFHTKWFPYCKFINVPRMDDIWAGFIWQRQAYDTGHCFNLNGPLVNHSRQSDVWANLRDEAVNLEKNERLWKLIASSPSSSYESLVSLVK